MDLLLPLKLFNMDSHTNLSISLGVNPLGIFCRRGSRLARSTPSVLALFKVIQYAKHAPKMTVLIPNYVYELVYRPAGFVIKQGSITRANYEANYVR